MRGFVVLAALLAAAPAARAATPEEGYIAARDKALATMKKLESASASDARMQAVEKAAFADLQKRLVAIVGPVSVKGFGHPPKINLDTLGDGPGNATLDGLAFESAPDQPEGSRLVVTSRALFDGWLKAHSSAGEGADRLPATMPEALGDDNFYTLAIGVDVAFSHALKIEVETPAGADFAFAALGRWAQDIGPSALDRIEAAVVKGGRVYVVDAQAAAAAPESAACKAVWEAANAKADKLNDAYQKGGAKDEKLFDESEKLRSQGSADWFTCEGKAIKAGASYPALKKEAQEWLQRLAGG